MKLKCKWCGKNIINRRACLYYRVDYEEPKTIQGTVKITPLCSVKCSLRFHGEPSKKTG